MPDEFESWNKSSGTRPERGRERGGFVPRASAVKNYGGQSKANPYAEEARRERRLFYLVIGIVIIVLGLGVFLYVVNSGEDEEVISTTPAAEPAGTGAAADPLKRSGW